jgi:hypothetical protein
MHSQGSSWSLGGSALAADGCGAGSAKPAGATPRFESSTRSGSGAVAVIEGR